MASAWEHIVQKNVLWVYRGIFEFSVGGKWCIVVPTNSRVTFSHRFSLSLEDSVLPRVGAPIQKRTIHEIMKGNTNCYRSRGRNSSNTVYVVHNRRLFLTLGPNLGRILTQCSCADKLYRPSQGSDGHMLNFMMWCVQFTCSLVQYMNPAQAISHILYKNPS